MSWHYRLDEILFVTVDDSSYSDATKCPATFPVLTKSSAGPTVGFSPIERPVLVTLIAATPKHKNWYGEQSIFHRNPHAQSHTPYHTVIVSSEKTNRRVCGVMSRQRTLTLTAGVHDAGALSRRRA